jgi:hypothetical protein
MRPQETTRPLRGDHFLGPSLFALGIVFTALFAASLCALVLSGAPVPTPNLSVYAMQGYFAGHAEAVRIAGFFQFGAAIPLVLYTATVTSKLRFLGIKAAGVSIALFGGIGASIFSAISGLIAWLLSQPGVALDASVVHALYLLAFATGGPALVAMLGLLLAGVSVPSAFAGLMPRWLVVLGLVVAVISELATLSLVFPVLYVLLPLGRFPAMVWMIGAGFSLPNFRRNRKEDNLDITGGAPMAA